MLQNTLPEVVTIKWILDNQHHNSTVNSGMKKMFLFSSVTDQSSISIDAESDAEGNLLLNERNEYSLKLFGELRHENVVLVSSK